MQRNKHTLVDLFTDSLESVEMDLSFGRTRWPIVAVDIANRGGKNVDTSGDEIIDVFWRGE